MKDIKHYIKNMNTGKYYWWDWFTLDDLGNGYFSGFEVDNIEDAAYSYSLYDVQYVQADIMLWQDNIMIEEKEDD